MERGLDKKIAHQKERYLSLGDNLYSRLNNGGSKTFLVRKKIEGIVTWYTLAKVGDISLSEARKWASQVVLAVDAGYGKKAIDSALKAANTPFDVYGYLNNPDVLQRAEQGSKTFRDVHTEWLENTGKVLADKTLRQYKNSIVQHLYPHFEHLPLKQITKADLAKVLRPLKINNYATYKKITQALNGMYDKAEVEGIVDINPLKLMTRYDIPQTNHAEKARSHIPVSGMPDLYRKITEIEDDATLMCKIAMFTGKRAAMVVQMEWADIDLDSGYWVVERGKTKNDLKHSVVLPPDGVSILKEQHKKTGNQKYVFGQPTNKTGLHHTNVILNRLKEFSDGRQTTHGLRHVIKTWCSEVGYRAEVRAVQLEHQKEGMSQVYDHADFLYERKIMMEHWQDYLQGRAELNERARV